MARTKQCARKNKKDHPPKEKKRLSEAVSNEPVGKKTRFDSEGEGEDGEEKDPGFLSFSSTVQHFKSSSTADYDESANEYPPQEGVVSSKLLTELPTPWRGHFTSSPLEDEAPPLIRLHNEILEFCSFITPTPAELSTREQLLQEITEVVASIWEEASVHVFGSQLTNLLTPTSDLDIAVLCVPESEDPHSALTLLANRIRMRMKVSYVEAILNAKVPIVKFDHTPTGISVDICVNNDSGINTGRLMLEYLATYPTLKPLLSVLKVFLSQRKLNETYTGGVGSFVLASMIVSYLQHRTRLAMYMKVYPNDHFNHNLGSFLLGFLGFYGNVFNYFLVGISLLDHGTYFNKTRKFKAELEAQNNIHRPGLLCIENPDQPGQDMGKNSYLLHKIRRAFDHVYQLLCAALREQGRESYLALVIRGDDESLLERARRNTK